MTIMNPHGAAVLAPQTEHATESAQREQSSHQKKPYSYYIRRLPRGFFNHAWLTRYDTLFVVLAYCVSGALWFWAPVYRMNERTFPLWYDPNRKVWYGPTSISQPRGTEVISSLNTAIVCTALPILVILLMQVFVRSFWDASSALWAVSKALALMTLLQEILKRFIARPRPYFLTECKPDGSLLGFTKTRYSPQWATIAACTVRPKPDAMQSFPSGHTASAFAVATFLALYLHAKLKASSNYHTNFGKHVAVVAPLIGALLISVGMIIDKEHHATDVLLSIPLGILCALLTYRSQYHSLFNYRNNHIPLPYRSNSKRYQLFKPKTPPPQTIYGVTDTPQPGADWYPVPDKYLAVSWPLRYDEKHGPVETKKQPPLYGPANAPIIRSPYASPQSHHMDLDGTSRDAVWSMSRASNAAETFAHGARGSASLGQASTIVRTPSRRVTSSGNRASVVAEVGSVRGRGVGGDGVGDEPTETAGVAV